MCGIVAVLRQPSTRPVPDAGSLLAAIRDSETALERHGLAGLEPALTFLRRVDESLRGTPGLACLLRQAGLVDDVAAAITGVGSHLSGLEADLDHGVVDLPPSEREQVNATLIGLKDACWAIERDRLGMARALGNLIPEGTPEGALDGWWAIQVALASLDRLEVRGRDSAGVHVMVVGHDVDPGDPDLLSRAGHPLFGSGAVEAAGGCLSFVYKVAAEIGELGDNVRVLRAAIRGDALLARALAAPGARVTVLGHTRWASVGLISEANAHPLNSREVDRSDGPYVVAALNGDVDNHAELRQAEGLAVAPEITTDAKVIPTLVSRRLDDGVGLDEAFRSTVARFEGSVAIAASSAVEPDQLELALCGSGQSLYVGLAEDAFVVASEPYGLVEETSRYVRMDGVTTQGQVVTLDRRGAGALAAMQRVRYDGGRLPLEQRDVVVAEITTRDIDRAHFHHFLLKELTEAPSSFRKTLRGRITSGADGRLAVRLGEDSIPPALADALAAGKVARVLVVGQGTAAVAGQSVAAAIARFAPELTVTAMPATELSGFGLADDMSDTLVIAISQSGTTTDTNRTVDLARTRGAHVLAVVNRRNSDLAAKVHGVLYTSDGRDVEMSVASTKAFYSQVAAGWLLAGALAPGAAGVDQMLRALRQLPEAMQQILARREEIGRIAASVAPGRRYWAVVGSGPDRVAAAEVRIKLSELCYRSISSDATEDKKHIDLSCEPLILVCAAGLHGPNADDVAKEIAIYRAHKAVPVVVASEGAADRFRSSARDVVAVPETEPQLAFVLSAMVGHLFGYEAALSIDAQARPLREARAAIEAAVNAGPEDLVDRLRPQLQQVTRPFMEGLREGSYNGNLEAATAVRLVSLLRYATGVLPLEGYEMESGKIGAPSTLIADLLDALNGAIDELTRPVDAIKHQAKTVTVGISRSEDALFGVPLVKATLGAGAAPDTLGYRALRTLGAVDESVAEVTGYTRYRIEWPPGASPTIAVVDQGGLARSLPSRTASDPRLLGSKHRAADEREVTVVRGASDGRTVILVPEVKGTQVVGMTLLHVRFHERLPWEAAKRVLTGYRTRYSALADAVTETEPVFEDLRLGDEPILELLTQPVYELATRWRRPSDDAGPVPPRQ
jgi:glucosamine--fructose-6-phosphate aminotransferase (isomerizing)